MDANVLTVAKPDQHGIFATFLTVEAVFVVAMYLIAFVPDLACASAVTEPIWGLKTFRAI